MRQFEKGAVPPYSPMVHGFFAQQVGRNFRNNFRALRLARADRFRAADTPLIVYLNHPSWWDPITALLIGRALMPERRHFAPMDERPLQRFPIMAKAGMFPVARGTVRGVRQLISTAKAILHEHQRNVLWITPQGRFGDVREPLQFAGGLGLLLSQFREATVQPLALEYAFWDQRQPEALALAGEPLFITPSDSKDPARMTAACVEYLQRAQAELAQLSIARDAKAFTTLVEGKRGTQGAYGVWQKMLSRDRNIRGE